MKLSSFLFANIMLVIDKVVIKWINKAGAQIIKYPHDVDLSFGKICKYKKYNPVMNMIIDME